MTLEEELIQLRMAHAGFEAQLAELRSENRRLVVENEQLTSANDRLESELSQARSDNEQLESRSDGLVEALEREQHDELTKAPRRSLFKEQADALIESASEGETIHCFFIDVRNMKRINDALGHDAADLLLASIGKAQDFFEVGEPGLSSSNAALVNLSAGKKKEDIDEVLKSSPTFGRWGGDEFVLVLRGGSTAEARRQYEKFKDRAFENFVETVANNWEMFQPTAEKGSKPHGDDARRVAARYFRLTPGLKSVPVDRSVSTAALRDFMIKEADKEMYKVKLLQRLVDNSAEIKRARNQARRAGVDLQPSKAWLDKTLTDTSDLVREFRALVNEQTSLSIEAGRILLEENSPWVQELIGDTRAYASDPNLEGVDKVELDAASYTALCLDLALIAQERLERDVIDPRIVFDQKIYDRDRLITGMVAMMKRHDYRSPVTDQTLGATKATYPRSALGIAVPTSGADRGYAAVGLPTLSAGL